MVKQQLRAQKQLKFTDSRFVQAMNATGTFVRWTPPAQGTTTYTRVADQIQVDKIEIRAFTIYGDAIGNVCRAVLLQTSGGFVPTLPDQVFNYGATATVDCTSDYLPFIRGKQIRVLYDSMYSVIPNASSAIKCQHMTVKPKLKNVDFVPGTTTCTNGDFYWFFITDSSVVPHPAINVQMRTYFVDP